MELEGGGGRPGLWVRQAASRGQGAPFTEFPGHFLHVWPPGGTFQASLLAGVVASPEWEWRFTRPV